MGMPRETKMVIYLNTETTRHCLDSIFKNKRTLIFIKKGIEGKEKGNICPSLSGKSFPPTGMGKCLHDSISPI